MSQLNSHRPQPVGENTPVELMPKHGGQRLLKPVRADQSEQTGRFGREALKTQAVKRGIQIEGEWRCCSN